MTKRPILSFPPLTDAAMPKWLLLHPSMAGSPGGLLLIREQLIPN